MNFVRLRNGKARVLVGFGAGLIILVLTYVMHDTHTKLIISRGLVLDCEHKQESLSAQLQVAFERRTRLEKTMQQEKLTYKQTKDKLEAQYEELQEQADKDKQEAQNKYAILQQQYKALQKQQENLHEEFSKLQQTNAELQEEKQNLINKMTSEMDQLRMAKDEEMATLQVTIAKLQQEKEEIVLKLDQSHLVQQLQASLQSCLQKSAVQDSKTLSGSAVHPSVQTVYSDSLSKNGSPKLPSINVKENEVIDDLRKDKSAMVNGGSSKTLNQKVVQQLPHQPVNPPSNVLLPPHNYGRVRPSPIAQNVQEPIEGHQLANPQDVELKINDDVHRQLEDPNHLERLTNDGKKEQLAEPPPDRAMNPGAAEHQDEREGAAFRREAELVPNGLEQQENGEDQDLDDMENENLDEKKNGNQFEDADFDQAEQDDNDGNRNMNANNQPVKPEGVVAAPH